MKAASTCRLIRGRVACSVWPHGVITGVGNAGGQGMAETKQAGLKSSFDLAMERMARRGESMATLTDEKKAALAEIGRRTTAKIAEVEILFDKKLAEAKAGNDAEKTAKLEEEKRTEIRRIQSRDEDERRKVRAT